MGCGAVDRTYYVGILVNIDHNDIFVACMGDNFQKVRRESISQKKKHGWFSHRLEIYQMKKQSNDSNGVFFIKKNQMYCVNFYLDNGYVPINVPCPYKEYCVLFDGKLSMCEQTDKTFYCERAYIYDVVENKVASDDFTRKFEPQLFAYFKEKYFKNNNNT